MKKRTLVFMVSLCVVLAATQCRAEVLVDQLDDTERTGGYAGTQSHISGNEAASTFKLHACAIIQKITWSGIIKQNAENLYPFAIRIYNDQGKRPARTHLYEFIGNAEIQSPGDNNTFPYIFSYTLDEDFYLPAGKRYWISISYAGPYADEFYIAIEENKTGTIYGHGGALRLSGDSMWVPTNMMFFAPYLRSRGRSIKIDGEYLSTDECPVISG